MNKSNSHGVYYHRRPNLLGGVQLSCDVNSLDEQNNESFDLGIGVNGLNRATISAELKLDEKRERGRSYRENMEVFIRLQHRTIGSLKIV